MKLSIIALLAFIPVAFNCLADCAGTGLSAFPYQGEINKNTVFVLDGYAESQQVINGLNEKFPVYLKSGDERIPLKVLEIHVGQFYLTQAVLKPEMSLIPGKKYQLVIDHLPDYEKLGVYNLKTHGFDPISYFVTDTTDMEAPVWTEKPQEKDKSLTHFGCGPSIHVNFKMDVKEQSEFLVKTTVKNRKTGTETIYYIGGKEGLSIGHGMCSGAFTFDDSLEYEAKFQLMDASGNISEETDWIAFTKPID
ncbi:hypothetical protein [Fluviicola sp.]|uniref:hypothetical protein n=1 Tax=Fluviicola sp. TaxID=1917219 RepID=UPI0031D56F0D